MSTCDEEWKARAEKAEAACAEMRAAIHGYLFSDDEDRNEEHAAMERALSSDAGKGWVREGSPVAMSLVCLKCSAPHIDNGEWATKPHHTHLCNVCQHQWMVYPYAVGVRPEGWVSPEEHAKVVAELKAQFVQYAALRDDMHLGHICWTPAADASICKPCVAAGEAEAILQKVQGE